MIDLEQDIRSALQTYAASVAPSVPPVEVVTADGAPTVGPSLATARRRSLVLPIAASLLLLAGGVVALSLRREGSTPGNGPSIATVEESSIGTWNVLPKAPLSARQLPSVVWTDTEFIVWGGQVINDGLTDGAAYNPTTAAWRKIAETDRAHPGATTVWTGDRMVVLDRGGGEAYDPREDAWSSLPSIDLAGSGGVGFTNAVWTGGQLLGLGVEIRQGQSNVAVLRVWTLDSDGSRWIPAEPVTIPSGRPKGRLASVSDRFSVYDPIQTDDGFVLWDGHVDGWRYRIDGGWTKLPTLTLPTGTILHESAVAWMSGHLTVIVNTGSSDGDEMQMTTLEQKGWSPLQHVVDGFVAFPRLVSTADHLILLGSIVRVAPGALLIDPSSSDAVPMTGYPIRNDFDQGVAWSGTQLMVWGGQTPTTGDEQSTSGTGRISDQGAIWTANAHPCAAVEADADTPVPSIRLEPGVITADTQKVSLVMPGGTRTEWSRPVPLTVQKRQSDGSWSGVLSLSGSFDKLLMLPEGEYRVYDHDTELVTFSVVLCP
jgi:hypothetical protein